MRQHDQHVAEPNNKAQLVTNSCSHAASLELEIASISASARRCTRASRERSSSFLWAKRVNCSTYPVSGEWVYPVVGASSRLSSLTPSTSPIVLRPETGPGTSSCPSPRPSRAVICPGLNTPDLAQERYRSHVYKPKDGYRSLSCIGVPSILPRVQQRQIRPAVWVSVHSRSRAASRNRSGTDEASSEARIAQSTPASSAASNHPRRPRRSHETPNCGNWLGTSHSARSKTSVHCEAIVRILAVRAFDHPSRSFSSPRFTTPKSSLLRTRRR